MLNNPFFLHKQVKILLVKILNIFLVKLFFFNFFILLKKKRNFVAPGEHGFPLFQVRMFTGSVSVLLSSASLKIKKINK